MLPQRPTAPARSLGSRRVITFAALCLPLLAALLFSGAFRAQAGSAAVAAAPLPAPPAGHMIHHSGAAPADDDGTATPGVPGCTVTGSITIRINESGFNPASATISPGTRVTWTNTGTDRHRVRDAGHNLFDSGDFYPGQSFSYVFCAAGLYPYEDARSNATGVITVDGPPGTPQTTGTPQATGTPGSGPFQVNIFDDDGFSPANLTIPVGSTVRWTNYDGDTHTATSPGNFNSGDIRTGQSWEFTFTSPGTFNYFCGYHSEMQGQIVVTGSGGSTATPQATNTPVAGTADVTIQNFAFTPQHLTVLVGTTVRWTNADSAPHTATSDNGTFSSGTLNQGQSWQYTFTTPGTYAYHCGVHPGMTGTITVVTSMGNTPTPAPSQTAPPSTTAAPSQTAPPSTTAAPSQTAPPGVANVVIQNYAFNPVTLTVQIGTTVRWTNLDNDNHTVSSNSGLFDSGVLGPNGTFQFTFTAPGTYGYECLVHPGFMPAAIVVQATAGTATPAATAIATPTQVPGPIFSDVNPGDYFYAAVNWLVNRGAITGYPDGTFRPYNNLTRGQATKVVVLAEGWPLANPATATFSDVPIGSTFFPYIETAFARGILAGYPDGTFRPNNNVTRAQLAKIIVRAQGWPLANPAAPTFSDVPLDNSFFHYVETAFARGVVSGYPDGTFRPNNSATRGQASKMIYIALTGTP